MKCEDCRHEPNSQGCIEAFDCDCAPSSWRKNALPLLDVPVVTVPDRMTHIRATIATHDGQED